MVGGGKLLRAMFLARRASWISTGAISSSEFISAGMDGMDSGDCTLYRRSNQRHTALSVVCGGSVIAP